jgi:hypothetical protein
MNILAHIVDEGYTSDMQVFSIECILQQLYHIIADSVLGREALGPREDLTLVQSCLLDRETERQTQRQGRIHVWVELIDA